MKTKILLFIYIIFTSFSSFDSNTKSNRQSWGLKGNVKSFSTATYKAVKKGDKVEKGNRKLRYKFDNDLSIVFNNKGNMLEMCFLKSNNSIVFKNVSQYDDKESVIQEDLYYADGRIEQQIKYNNTYDGKGRVIAHIMSYDGKNYKRTFNYDENGKIIEKASYETNDSLSWKITYLRDNDGKTYQQTYYNARKKILTVTKYSYRYDNKGNLIEQSSQSDKEAIVNTLFKYDDNGNKVESTYVDSKGVKVVDTYEYDNYGNWTKEIEYRNGKAVFVTERQLEYF